MIFIVKWFAKAIFTISFSHTEGEISTTQY